MLVAVLAGIAAAVAPVASARPGDLDPTFGGQGKFTGGSAPTAIAVQADRKTVIVTNSTLVRLRANGRLDKPFGAGKDDGSTPNGIPVGYSGSGGADVALQPDGKILVLGYEDRADGTASFVVARHTPEGELDPTFGSGGRASIQLEGGGGLDDFGPEPSMALMADGRIMAGGMLAGTPQVARFSPAGLPDTTLGGDGLVTAELGPDDRLADLAAAGDGKIVLAGQAKPTPGQQSDFAVARLDAAGLPDPAFSGDGVQSVDFGAGDAATGVAVQPDGAVVAGGSASHSCRGDSCEQQFALARLDPAGELDPAFAGTGKTTVRGPAGIDGNAVGFELQADGKLVVAGGGNDFLLARLNPDGTPDAEFGDAGRAWTPFLGTYPAYASALALTPDGGIVVAGFVYLEEFYDERAIARYEGGPGPADLDGDGFGDADDACPRTFGEHKSGCPVIVRKLKLKLDAKKDRIGVRVGVRQKSGEPLAGYRAQTAQICSGQGKVSLLKQRKGPDRVVDTDNPNGGYEFDSPGRGSFYARIGKATPTAFQPDGPVELCAADRSPALQIRR